MSELLDDHLHELCRSSLRAFVRFAFNETPMNAGVKFENNWHIDCICEHLEAMNDGQINKLIINVPPRSLKSYTCSQALPAWLLGNTPTEKIMNVSSGHSIIEQNALGCKAIMQSDFYKGCFPGVTIGGLDRITDFGTNEGGSFYADSLGGVIMGKGANWIIIDDPLKVDDATSDAIRDATNEKIRSTVLNRFNDRRIGKLLMIMQRLHEDDPAGHLLGINKDIVHLKLPAETKTHIHISLERHGKTLTWDMEEGDLLFPARLSREILDEIQMSEMSPYVYAGQMLQEPVPIGGGEFKADWFVNHYYESGFLKPAGMNIAILCDASGGEDTNRKKKKNSDYTAFVVVGLNSDNNYYLLDIIRDRFNPTERIDSLFTLHRKWNSLTGKSPKVGYEKYGLMSDTHYIKQKMRTENYMFPLVELGGKMSKEDRIRRLIPDLQNGRWYFPTDLLYVDIEGRQYDLVSELINKEMATFPRGRYDDMLDALTRIYDQELNMIFPRLQVKAKDNIHKRDNKIASWLDF